MSKYSVNPPKNDSEVYEALEYVYSSDRSTVAKAKSFYDNLRRQGNPVLEAFRETLSNIYVKHY